MVQFWKERKKKGDEDGVKWKSQGKVIDRGGAKVCPLFLFLGRHFAVMHIVYFFQSLFLILRDKCCYILEFCQKVNICLYFLVQSLQFGTGSGAEVWNSCVYCIFCRVYFGIKRQIYKYLKPLIAKCSRYCFTSLGVFDCVRFF